MKSFLQLTGIGLRAPHYAEFIDKQPKVAWIEVHSENYFAEGGIPLHTLEIARQQYPISLHGVGLSLGSTDDLNWHHLKQLRDLILRINPCLVSDHLSWSSINGQYLHDLLPLPYTQESLEHLISRVGQIQDYLNRQILIENISSYIQFDSSDIPEPEFLNTLAERSGCGLLLDINNLYVNATNFSYHPQKYLAAITSKYVQEIHLAGFTTSIIQDKEILIDTHNRPIVPAVWELYRQAIQILGRKPTIIEWDSDLPSLDTLFLEAFRAETILKETHVSTKPTD